jgi:hypothetical protein
MRFFSLMPAVGCKLHQTVIFAFMAVFLAFPAIAVTFPRDKLRIDGTPYSVELATTPAQLAHGLMFRKHLASDHGMLFVFDTPQILTMWMKNTLIPLDMLFIDAEGTVIFIAENTTPHSEALISSPIPAKAVLELAGGNSKKNHIHIGSKVSHATFTTHIAH